MERVTQAARRTADAAAETGVDVARAAVEAPAPGRGAGSTDPLIGDLRRAGLLPLLVLHFAVRRARLRQPADRADLRAHAGRADREPEHDVPAAAGAGGQGLVAGEWEHPERRSRRFYRVTEAGEEEHKRLAGELAPRLDRIAASIEAIRSELSC